MWIKYREPIYVLGDIHTTTLSAARVLQGFNSDIHRDFSVNSYPYLIYSFGQDNDYVEVCKPLDSHTKRLRFLV